MKTLVLIAACVCATSVASAFEVTWDGRPVAVHPARVSAEPINQVWPGYQRPIEQTKMASFVSFDLPKPGELAVTPGEGEDAGEPIFLPLSWKPAVRRTGRTLFVRVERPRQFALAYGRENMPESVEVSIRGNVRE